ncbi:hypothetical protein N7468_001638 [Penicillium chermesinum]|uniref:Uncharacterized protein n=1 Tax=Penicillium chermesinum TaxID=63820 RepID=A0A9W9TWY5_9EURO|nr:uncharacterized protein N7468_001638 [Penicillium chermesinum]KAJ5246655.1 hypothetical protein N7468_001638 [Penicillium chermesinum]
MTRISHQWDDADVCEMDILDHSFLNDLVPFTKTFSYDGEHQLNNLLDSEFSERTAYFLLRSGKKSIESIIKSVETYSISSFDITEGLILFKLSFRTHAAAVHEINLLIIEKLLPMGLDKAIQGFPRPRITGKESTRGKEPDYSWCPTRTPRSSAHVKTRMPTVALEVAVTEDDKKLNSDVRYWLSPNDGNANLCLTLRINPINNEIRMESWARKDNNDNKQRARIDRTQVIYVHSTQEGRPIVTGDLPFRIPFESLMLRPIDAQTAAEQDIIFSQADLEEAARSIWIAEEEEEE